MSTIINSSDEFKTKVLEGEGKILVDFYADWCGPCKMLGPVMDEISKDYTVYKVNVDDNQDLAVKYAVTAIPTLIVIKNGEETNRTVGVASKSEIEAMIFKK